MPYFLGIVHHCTYMWMFLWLILIYCGLFSNTFLYQTAYLWGRSAEIASTKAEETGRSQKLRTPYCAETNSGEPGLHKDILSQPNRQTNKETNNTALNYPNNVALNFIIPCVFVYMWRWSSLHVDLHMMRGISYLDVINHQVAFPKEFLWDQI